MAVKDREILHRIWDGFLNSVGMKEEKDTNLSLKKRKNFSVSEEKQRSMSMSRLREQLWYALDNAEGGWAYPIDVFVGDDGNSLFSIVAQSGKLFQVPLTVVQEELSLGEWVQVKEEFTPVTQNRFFIRRQKDGKYRWTAIAGTSVLNRVGQIDSTKLFDSFIEKAEKREKYPRLDFYHWGETDPTVWEFGTADYLARDGVCYIASGLFDEDHPLAKATIRACESGEGEWGCSIEFYAYAEPEKIMTDPEIEIPVYNDGENTRISVVLEEDAAGLFTRIGVKEGISRSMDKATRQALEKLYGEDTEGLQDFINQFEDGVDETNKRVKNDKLIHRAKTDKKDPDPEEVDDEEEDQEQDDEENQDEEEDNEIVLDEGAVAAITQQMFASPEFKQIVSSLEEVKQTIAQSLLQRENDAKEIAQLKKTNAQFSKAIERLNKDDAEKKSEYLQDMPSRKKQTVTFRARDARNEEEDYSNDILEDLEDIADRTLRNLPAY